MEANLPLPLLMEYWVQSTKMDKMNNSSFAIRKLLAYHLGLEPTDIEDEDSLTIDLHMTPADLTDFIETLNSNGFDSSKLDFSEIETFGELNEKLT